MDEAVCRTYTNYFPIISRFTKYFAVQCESGSAIPLQQHSRGRGEGGIPSRKTAEARNIQILSKILSKILANRFDVSRIETSRIELRPSSRPTHEESNCDSQLIALGFEPMEDHFLLVCSAR